MQCLSAGTYRLREKSFEQDSQRNPLRERTLGFDGWQ
jgi:hypothetical protein